MSLNTAIAYWTRGGLGLPNAFNWQARAKFGPSIIEDGQSKLALGQALSLRTIGGFGANGGTMAPLSNRRHGGVYSKAQPAGGAPAKRGRPSGQVQSPWSDEDLRVLSRLYGQVPNRELSGRLGRSIKSIQSKAAKQGLTK